MSKIKNVDELRDFALETLMDLRNGKIDVAQAAATAKVMDSVIQTVNAQLEYYQMIAEKPSIPFMYNARKLNIIEGNVSKQLEHDK